MLSRIKLWLYGSAAAIVIKASLWLYWMGRRSEQNKHTRRRLDAMKDAKDIRHEVEGSDDKRLVDILTGRVRK